MNYRLSGNMGKRHSFNYNKNLLLKQRQSMSVNWAKASEKAVQQRMQVDSFAKYR
jgi:hypothetical protein